MSVSYQQEGHKDVLLWDGEAPEGLNYAQLVGQELKGHLKSMSQKKLFLLFSQCSEINNNFLCKW